MKTALGIATEVGEKFLFLSRAETEVTGKTNAVSQKSKVSIHTK